MALTEFQKRLATLERSLGVQTRHGRTLDLRELGANKVLAIFDSVAARDFVDLAEVAVLVPFDELVDLALTKDRGVTPALLARAITGGHFLHHYRC